MSVVCWRKDIICILCTYMDMKSVYSSGAFYISWFETRGYLYQFAGLRKFSDDERRYYISTAWCKTTVYPLLMHWRYYSLALNHRYVTAFSHWLRPELVNLTALRFLIRNKISLFQCVGKILRLEFRRFPLKFPTKYLTHTLKDM